MLLMSPGSDGSKGFEQKFVIVSEWSADVERDAVQLTGDWKPGKGEHRQGGMEMGMTMIGLNQNRHGHACLLQSLLNSIEYQQNILRDVG